MTRNQKMFCDEYLIDLNATRAYKAAYKNVKKDETAAAAASRLLRNVKIKTYIDKQMDKIQDKQIAKAEEVLEYLTSVLRGEETEEVVVTENIGDFKSEAKVIDIKVSSKERIKAAELIGRRYGAWKDVADKDKEVAQLDQIKVKTEKLKGISSDIEDMSELRKLLLNESD